MGKVIYKRRIMRDEDIRQLKTGPIAILTGASLKKPTKLKPKENENWLRKRN
jgi:hypothetical protein